MDLSMSRTYICTNTRANRFLWRVATYISSTPFCGRASSMKNYVAHHDKRKVKPYERPRHISLSCTRKRSKHRITLIERKTSSTSTIMMSFLHFSFSFSSCISPSEWSTRSSRRDSIIAVLSQLYGRVHVTIVKRESPNDSRYYLAADNEVHYPNAAAGETGFVRHTTMVNPGSTCTRIILAIHFALGRERGWPPKTVEDEDETKHIARKIEIRKARDKRARRKSLLSVQLGVFRETVFEEDSARSRQDGRRFDGRFDGVQGNFMIRAEHPPSRGLFETTHAVVAVCTISISLSLFCRASRCRKRVLRCQRNAIKLARAERGRRDARGRSAREAIVLDGL